MTPQEFKAARKQLGLTQNELAAEWKMGKNGGRTVRRWEHGECNIGATAVYAIKLMLQSGRLLDD